VSAEVIVDVFQQCARCGSNVPCGSCSGKGGWSMCLADEEWCKTHPLPAPRATDDNGKEG
jgi:hypothetical protein